MSASPVPPHSPPDLPADSHPDQPAAASAALHDAARELLARGNRLQHADDQGQLLLTSQAGQQRAASLPCTSIRLTGGQLLLALEHEHGNSPLGDARWQDYEGEARLLAWTLSHEKLVATLEQVFADHALPQAFLPHGGRDRLWLALSYRDQDGQALQGWLGLAPEQIRQLARTPGWDTDPDRPGLLGDLDTLGLELLIAGRALEPAAIDALALGDVLVIGTESAIDARLYPDDDTAQKIFGLPEGWAVQRRNGQWAVVARPLLETPGEPTRPLFRLTRLGMSLADVDALKPGRAVVHDAALSGCSVDILLAGRHFGEGTLVTLGELLGVRITGVDTTRCGDDHGLH